MATSFVLALKSTLDKAMLELANSAGLDLIDLDGAPLNSERLLQARNAIAWTQTHFAPAPGHSPLYDFGFHAGGVTTADPAQYESMDITGLLLQAFAPQTQLDIYDYSGEHAGTTKLGDFSVTSVSVNPLQHNEVEGIRYITVSGTGVRYGG